MTDTGWSERDLEDPRSVEADATGVQLIDEAPRHAEGHLVADAAGEPAEPSAESLLLDLMGSEGVGTTAAEAAIQVEDEPQGHGHRRGRIRRRRAKRAMSETVVLWVVVITLAGMAGYLIGMLLRSILEERRRSRVRRIWKNFALSITFAILFLTSWAVQGIAEWGVYREDQRNHGKPAVLSEYIVGFGQSTLENWQSEFLQLFSFVVLSAVFIHRGSSESKDGTDKSSAP